MVRGLDKFRDYFKDHSDSYIIIGGTACDLIIGAAGLTPRATRDIDIIIVVEALNPVFVTQFWNFIKEGQYEKTEKNEDERKYYRFLKPANADFPYQVELFSRVPELLDIKEASHLTPIPVDDDLSSLSAILMNDDYYNYTLNHCKEEKGIKRANTEALVCLKARAYLDMMERKDNGKNAEEKNIKKHKADVFRLSATLAEVDVFELPEAIQKDMQAFVDATKNELPDKAMFKEMGLGNIDPHTLLEQLIQSFQLKN